MNLDSVTHIRLQPAEQLDKWVSLMQLDLDGSNTGTAVSEQLLLLRLQG